MNSRRRHKTETVEREAMAGYTGLSDLTDWLVEKRGGRITTTGIDGSVFSLNTHRIALRRNMSCC